MLCPVFISYACFLDTASLEAEFRLLASEIKRPHFYTGRIL